jgi:hypothetical protein
LSHALASWGVSAVVNFERITISTTKSTPRVMFPESSRTPSPSRAMVSSKVPPSNWNMPKPPSCRLQGPSPAPATTGPPPQSGDAGPWQAQSSSVQQCERLVSALAMPASRYPVAMPLSAATSRMAPHRSVRSASLSGCAEARAGANAAQTAIVPPTIHDQRRR